MIWVEVITGLGLDDRGSVSVLDNSTWRERSEQLEKLGGDPTTAPRWSLDPILFGPHPTVRAKAWIERKRWDEAEAAFAEAAWARPLDTAILIERGRFFAARTRPQRAEAEFVRAYALGNRDPELLDTILVSESLFRRVVAERPQDAAPLWTARGYRFAQRQRWSEAATDYLEAVLLEPEVGYPRDYQILALMAAGDHNGLRRAQFDMLGRFGKTKDPEIANNVAWWSARTKGEEPNLSEAVRLAEIAVNGAPEDQKGDHLNTLGAALYRARRYAEAVKRLDEGIQKHNGKSEPQEWVFLALAHHRLGHHEQARRWLDRFQDYRPKPLPPSIALWNELEIHLLRSEAEAVILYDPIFPADPFAN